MKNIWNIFLLTVILATGCHITSAADPVAPKGWLANSNLDVDDTERLLRSALENEQGFMPQQTTNHFLRAVASMQDARLFVVYTRLYEMLGASDRVKLYEEQTLWIRKREKDAKDATLTDAGGSAEPADYWGAFCDVTKKRQKELLKRINALSKKG